MRFMILRRAGARTEAGVPPGKELLDAMRGYVGSLLKAGVLLAADGLRRSSEGARVTFSGGRPTVTDGPFSEAKGLVAGWALIQVTSREGAVEWVKRWPPEDGGGNVAIEIRRALEPGDLGGDVAYEPEHRERLPAQAAAQKQQQALRPALRPEAGDGVIGSRGGYGHTPCDRGRLADRGGPGHRGPRPRRA